MVEEMILGKEGSGGIENFPYFPNTFSKESRRRTKEELNTN
jgi:hypothetical protein